MAAERRQSPEKVQPPANDQDAADQPSSGAASAVAVAPASPQADQPEPADQAEQADLPEPVHHPEPADQPEPANQAEPPAEPEPAGPDLNLEVTVVPGVPRYHNAQCILIRFMGENDLEKMTLGAAREIGCTPCRACLPDQPDKAPE